MLAVPSLVLAFAVRWRALPVRAPAIAASAVLLGSLAWVVVDWPASIGLRLTPLTLVPPDRMAQVRRPRRDDRLRARPLRLGGCAVPRPADGLSCHVRADGAGNDAGRSDAPRGGAAEAARGGHRRRRRGRGARRHGGGLAARPIAGARRASPPRTARGLRRQPAPARSGRPPRLTCSGCRDRDGAVARRRRALGLGRLHLRRAPDGGRAAVADRSAVGRPAGVGLDGARSPRPQPVLLEPRRVVHPLRVDTREADADRHHSARTRSASGSIRAHRSSSGWASRSSSRSRPLDAPCLVPKGRIAWGGADRWVYGV